jgi:hypothetical protein
MFNPPGIYLVLWYELISFMFFLPLEMKIAYFGCYVFSRTELSDTFHSDLFIEFSII